MVVGPLALPATVIFLGLMVGGLLLVVSWMLQGSDERSDDPTSAACPRCRYSNPTHARYCGRCGRALT